LSREFATLTAAIRSVVADGATELKAVSAEAADQAKRLLGMVESERENLAQAIAAAESDTASLRGALRQQLDDITAAAARVTADTSGIGTMFETHAAGLVQAARLAGEEAANLRALLDEQATQLSSVFARTAMGAQQMQELVATQTESLEATVEAT